MKEVSGVFNFAVLESILTGLKQRIFWAGSDMNQPSEDVHVQVNHLVEYVFSLARALQNAKKDDLSHFNNQVCKDVINEFIEDTLPSSLIIQKLKDSWKVSRTLNDVHEASSIILIIKELGPLVQDKELETQIQVMNIPHMGSSFETLKSLVSLGVSPYFDAITSNNKSDIITATKKRISELALSLSNLDQAIQTPDLSVSLHPIIKDAIRKGANLQNYTEYIPNETLNDSIFLNSIQTIVNEWVKSIQGVTKLNREVSEGSAADEINFWISMETTLAAIQNQLDSDGVQLSLEVLKYAKRYHATASFFSDIEIKDAIATATDYNKLMKDFPLNELLVAADLEKVEEAIVLILNHLKRLRLTNYPISRSLPLVEAISSDLERKLKSMLSNAMALPFSEFTAEAQQLNSIFDTWDRHVKEFTNVARELLRKRGEKFLFVKINSKTIAMKERLQDAEAFKLSHKELADAISRVKINNTELDYAYEAMNEVDIFADESQWITAKKLYNRRIQEIENRIVENMRESLDKSKNSNEMFQVFENFRHLLERPRIRGATQEYQAQLLAIVKDEIAQLQENFNKKTDEKSLASLHDYPSVAFTLLWAKQVENKLLFLTDRLELVLGEDWSLYAEGQKISAEITVFKKKLDTKSIFEEWLNFASECKIEGNILKLVKDKEVKLDVNFDERLMQLFKEVRSLSWQGFQVPHGVILSSRQARKVYPHAVILTETIAEFPSLLRTIETLQDFKILLAQEKLVIYELIEECLSIKWDTLTKAHDLRHIEIKTSEHTQEQTIIQLEQHISDFKAKLELASRYKYLLNENFQLLQSCKYNSENFENIIAEIQKMIDQINLDGFSNVQSFVRMTNLRLRKTLVDRALKEGFEPQPTSHQIVMGAVVSVSPPLEISKVLWIHSFQTSMNVVNCQRKIFERQQSENPESLIGESETEILEDHLTQFAVKIEKDYLDAQQFINSWSQFEAFWNLQSDDIYQGLDIDGWLEILEEVKKSRQTFETNENFKAFGYFEIGFDKAREKVRSRFSAWNKELITRFGVFLSDVIRSTHESVVSGKRYLETKHLDLGSVKDTIEMVAKVEEYKTLLHKIGLLLVKFKFGQKILARQRYQYPSDFVYCEQIESDYEALQSLVTKKSNSINSQMDVIVKNVEAESQRLESLIIKTKESWSESKPTSESTTPSAAFEFLSNFELNLADLNERKNLISRAASLLSIPILMETDVASTLEEAKDLKSVWVSIQSLWNTLSDLKSLRWHDVKPRHIRKELDKLLVTTKSMPVRVRHHKPFQNFLQTLNDLSNSQKFIIPLKEDQVKERHLKSLFKSLNKHYRSSLTVGDVWDLQLILHESLIKSVLDQASAEKVLEDSLQTIKDFWEQSSFELFNFHGQNLVKNLAPLIEQASSDSQSLDSMRNSPYYRVFEEDAAQWEGKLSKVHQIMNTWVEAQRQWIDLDGIFDEKSGIRKLLQSEASRFQMVSAEFVSMLKKVYKHTLAVEIVSITDIQDVMERISESLSRIAKALGEFLERQRDLFPRFYFVGNEDLLEILGNMGDLGRVSKHLRKMFAGVADLKVNKDSSEVTAIVSAEGETVPLVDPISLLTYSRVDEWLAQLDYEIRHTLSVLVERSLDKFQNATFEEWVVSYPAQVILLTLQIRFTSLAEESIISHKLEDLAVNLDHFLSILAGMNKTKDKAIESFIIEIIHQRTVVESLKGAKVQEIASFTWVSQQRYYYSTSNTDYLRRLEVRQLTKTFTYDFEYFGVMERLVSTPLLQNCFLAMTAALDQGLGGSPFGPAGTGKTETIKALGQNLGKMVLVFNCDETFDFQAMGRLLLGICKVGAWGCFDEFNRLDKNILSAVSSQIEQIENGLKLHSPKIDLLNRETEIMDGTGIFITMNPTYSGRTTLPDNLKKLFRSFSMKSPDSEIIGEVLLTSWGFKHSKSISQKVVLFFQSLQAETTARSHYDFGLRAFKNVLANAGKILSTLDEKSFGDSELIAIVKSLNEMVNPRLIDKDVVVFERVKRSVFGDLDDHLMDSDLASAFETWGTKHGLKMSASWITKLLQLYKIQESQQGVMIVGKAGRGKTTLWSTLLGVLSKLENKEALQYVIDPKVLSKNELFGRLDPITRDWNDGLLTSIIRKVIENLRGELDKRVWIVFDGDVDPIWIESLNSVLDDNKLLTLPNGERLRIPPNVRFIFEVDNLEHATPATISRCGIIWIEDAFTTWEDVLFHELWKFQHQPLDDLEEVELDRLIKLQCQSSQIMEAKLSQCLNQICDFCIMELTHVMKVDILAKIKQLFVFMRIFFRKTVSSHLENRISEVIVTESYITKALFLSFLWVFAGSCSLNQRQKLLEFLVTLDVFQDYLPPASVGGNMLDFDVAWNGEWVDLNDTVVLPDLPSQAVIDPNTVIQTVDTLKHENLIHAILQERTCLILCGPPGSGKTMTLYAALARSPDIEVSNLNFSKETSPSILLKAIEQLCEYKKTIDGLMLRPKVSGKRVVFFCDEINLPRADAYGTQHVISFMRQLIERNGFWKSSDKQWVNLVDVQFVGACNPPSDAGRRELTPRFSSHLCLIMVDYPGATSLAHIYNCMNTAALKMVPHLSGYSKDLTSAMLSVYENSISHFSNSNQKHYVYSPRELTRWVRGIYNALQPSETLDLNGVVKIWAHEALRLFSDRLVLEEERKWTSQLIDSVALEKFPSIEYERALKRPILFSNWLSLSYEPVDEEELASFIRERLKIFAEEILDVNLVLYDDAIDHILRIDRVLKQPQGHLILVGPSSTGKTSLTKFVSWINGLKIVQLGVSRDYTLEKFDEVLKGLLMRSGIQGESICFIVDESTILDGAFLERMNSLLANSQIQEIFDQDEYNTLLSMCKDQVQARGLLLDTVDELFGWFTQQVANNLHIVFTINDPNDTSSPQIISSPALFNRCVLNWMGEWSMPSMTQISRKLLESMPIDKSSFEVPNISSQEYCFDIRSHRDAIIQSILSIHKESALGISSGTLLDFISNFSAIFSTKETELQMAQRRLNSGLDKLRETVIKVKYLKEELSAKELQLTEKDKEARDMLNKILVEQNEAERKQEASVHLQGALERQNVKLVEHRKRVMEDLALAEPAVMEARRGVKNIKKQHLTELRSMSTPPAMVQMTLESVCILLGYNVSSWRDVQLIIRKDDFIFNIVNFDCETQVTQELREYMEETYLSRSDYNFDSADRASKACGPLLQWVQAQVRYSIVLDQIGPLREDMAILEEESRQNEARLLAIDDMINELQESIETYKNDYSHLIRDTENIKSNISEVQAKVKRSMRLVENLTEERTRWSENVKKYTKEYDSLAGDSLLASAFLTYASSDDHQQRMARLKGWKERLRKLSIQFNGTFSILEFFGSSTNSLRLVEEGLTNDVLYFENVSILEKTQKVPFIIDPLGQIVDFLKAHLKPKKLLVTSFLDDSFVKSLENAMRFGGTIVIQDAEYFDPIISRLLNHDFEKVGGRRLVRIGNRDVDCSPAFTLFLHTRDPSVKITPYVLSRTTVTDFTLTESSIETQVMNITLANDRPDIEKQRLDLVKLNGEYKQKLQNLENNLLQVLSETKENLLDSDELIDTLEQLKTESAIIKEKVKDTATVMLKVNDATQVYRPLAKNSSFMFTLLKKLKDIHSFYEFPLSSFMSWFSNILGVPKSEGHDRVDDLISGLYKEVFANISLSLLRLDKMLVALVMSLLYLKEKETCVFSLFVSQLLKIIAIDDFGSEMIQQAFSILSIDLDQSQLAKPIKASEISAKYDVHISAIAPLIDAIFEESTSSGGVHDAFCSISKFLFTGIGPYTSKYDLGDVSYRSKGYPIILASTAGYDATFKVKKLASDQSVNLKIVGMGSREANKIALTELNEAAKNGGWVILQNVQTSSAWLENLEKLLMGLSLNEKFRLFLTCEITSEIPTTLLRSSDVLVFENSPGVKTIMTENFKGLNEKWNTAKPVEKRHIYFLLCWYHSIIQERTRYVPFGLSKNYDFNDSDFDSAVFYLDSWFHKISDGRENVSPEGFHWDAIQVLIGDIIYGGKVDDENDQEYLRSLSRLIFRIESFDHDYNLIENDISQRLGLQLSTPEGVSFDAYNDWINELPDIEPPSWIGLENDADLLVMKKEARTISGKALKMLEDLGATES